MFIDYSVAPSVPLSPPSGGGVTSPVPESGGVVDCTGVSTGVGDGVTTGVGSGVGAGVGSGVGCGVAGTGVGASVGTGVATTSSETDSDCGSSVGVVELAEEVLVTLDAVETDTSLSPICLATFFTVGRSSSVI